ncbi:MAG: NADH:ubiquinone reductase (Na(+)-transporting) subunit F [Desulfobacterales bacterium CG23_combo_of_CG06-09_8_20_14_all_52_9]|nr:MAG: NADH:ubiquinone reductase (Na(+)-transporting) subunit F [Desulfobacterales bacterium CG23_combo_of_CG06-09_8_20_14_all_52_9]
METWVTAVTVFAGVIGLMVIALLLVEAKVVIKGDRTIVINEDPAKSIQTPMGTTLLSALTQNGVLLPSACGGKGSCGLCKCRVEAGGRDILPTELAHLNREEKQKGIRLACQLKVKEDMKIRIPQEIFNIKKYSAIVVSNENLASFIKELRLKLEGNERMDFKTGAYVQIDIPEYERSYREIHVGETYKKVWDRFDFWGLKAKAEEPIFRAYSLANTPEEAELMFTIRIATPPPGKIDILPGIASSYLFTLEPGDQVTLSGPYGDFFIKDTRREMCFIGGGAGMAPLRAHIFHQLLTVRTERKMSFWYGARSKKELFYEDEFRELAKHYSNFKFVVSLSEPEPEDRWEGPTGYIHQTAYEQYLKNHPDPTEIEFYLCGPPPMLKAVREMLDTIGVEQEMIAFDDFGV